MHDDLQKPSPANAGLKDTFGRAITYLRLSVTDRCDLRCTYCMAEKMTFLPRKDVLSLEELVTLSDTFIERGVERIRLTGGEPLVRKDIMHLIRELGQRVKTGLLRELTLTTNGTQLPHMAEDLYSAGIRRVNISLDSLDAEVFAKITRRNQLPTVLAGVAAAKSAGLRVKVNMVVQKGVNDTEILPMLHWCMDNELDLTLIETMPMGDVEADRADHYVPLMPLLSTLGDAVPLTPTPYKTGGPARYYSAADSATRLGIISPLSGNFCDGCNRVRVTCTGRIYMCLGQDNHIDLMQALRDDPSGNSLHACLDKAMLGKPRGHDFAMEAGKMVGKVGRHMSHTGG